MPPEPHLAIIGGGPAGLMAAEAAIPGGASVDVYDAMPSVGRKFLLAGKGGLNLTHAEPPDAFLPRYGARPVETFGLLALDVRHRLKREATISVGCLTSSLVHPREVFQEAVTARAAALVLFHNHPSGDPEPSAEDVALTRRLCSAGTLMGIEVLDHIVLGAGRFVSLKERGIL